jgi:twitching motility protein PilT
MFVGSECQQSQLPCARTIAMVGGNFRSEWDLIVEFVRKHNCSDLTFNRLNVTGKVDNCVIRLSDDNAFTKEEFEGIIHSLVSHRSDSALKLSGPMPSVDLSVVKSGMRFRVNIVRAQGELTASLRPLPEDPPLPKEIGFGEMATKTITGYASGLIILSGPTGSGKTTSIASFIRAINETQPVKIVMIEDPIEYEFKNVKAEIVQREVGTDCRSFAVGTRDAMRQGPNILVVGEIRDGETAKAAFYAAETGHLVFGTLHADRVLEIPSRLLNLLPAEDKAHGRYLLSMVAKAFVSQRLLRLREGGRVAAREILLHVPAVPALIEKAKEHEFAHLMRSHQSLGMIDLQTDLSRLRGRIALGEYEKYKEE